MKEKNDKLQFHYFLWVKMLGIIHYRGKHGCERLIKEGIKVT